VISEDDSFRIGDLVRVDREATARLLGRYGHIAEVLSGERGPWIVVSLAPGEERVRFFPGQLSLVDDVVSGLAGLA